jgi:membrane protein YqaA with SNARE-associated domain
MNLIMIMNLIMMNWIPPLAVNIWTVLKKLGGPGLIVLGIIDSSAVPVPGSQDLLTIILSTVHRDLWLYYALMATAGSVAGGYLTYRLGKKGGTEAFESRVPAKKLEKVDKTFEKWGFGSVFLGAILPPPFPMVPVIVAAGALQYPAKKFLAALGLGRALRFTVVAYIGSIYGQAGFHFITSHSREFTIVLIAAGLLGATTLAAYLIFRKRRQAA